MEKQNIQTQSLTPRDNSVPLLNTDMTAQTVTQKIDVVYCMHRGATDGQWVAEHLRGIFSGIPNSTPTYVWLENGCGQLFPNIEQLKKDTALLSKRLGLPAISWDREFERGISLETFGIVARFEELLGYQSTVPISINELRGSCPDFFHPIHDVLIQAMSSRSTLKVRGECPPFSAEISFLRANHLRSKGLKSIMNGKHESALNYYASSENAVQLAGKIRDTSLVKAIVTQGRGLSGPSKHVVIRGLVHSTAFNAEADASGLDITARTMLFDDRWSVQGSNYRLKYGVFGEPPIMPPEIRALKEVAFCDIIDSLLPHFRNNLAERMNAALCLEQLPDKLLNNWFKLVGNTKQFSPRARADLIVRALAECGDDFSSQLHGALVGNRH